MPYEAANLPDQIWNSQMASLKRCRLAKHLKFVVQDALPGTASLHRRPTSTVILTLCHWITSLAEGSMIEVVQHVSFWLSH